MKLPSITDYANSVVHPICIKAPSLQGGLIEKKGSGGALFFSGGFAVVFKFLVGGDTYALRCWHKVYGNAAKRSAAISTYLEQVNLPYFVGFNYIDKGVLVNGNILPIIKMDWVKGDSLKSYVKAHQNDSSKLKKLAEDFKSMVGILHAHQISHGDLQHDNILVRRDGSLALVDYDSLYVPALKGEDDVIKGLPAYQHPARAKEKFTSEHVDYFSELLIYVSILGLAHHPELWSLMPLHKWEQILIGEEDIKNPQNSPLFLFFSKSPNKELRKLSRRLAQWCLANTLSGHTALEVVIQKETKFPWEGRTRKKPTPKVPPKSQILVDSKSILGKTQKKKVGPLFPSTHKNNDVDRETIFDKFKKKKKK